MRSVHDDEHTASYKNTINSNRKSKEKLEIRNWSTISKTPCPRQIKQGTKQQRLQLNNRSFNLLKCATVSLLPH